MTITLRPDQEKLIAEAIESGAYQDTNDVIDRALVMLREQGDWLSEHRQEISDKIDRGFAQFERGEFYTAEQAQANMAKRKTEWLRNRQAQTE